MIKTSIKLKGKPYFIDETRGGIFRVVRSLDICPDGERDKLKFRTSGKELSKGLDICEISSRNISLLVEVQRRGVILEYIIEGLRKLAGVAECDYFSYEPFGTSICETIAENDICGYYKVMPRLFRRIVND